MINSNILLLVAFILGGITTLIILWNYEEVKQIMFKEDSMFTGQINNTIDAYRILRTYLKSQTLNEKDKGFLGRILILIGINLFILAFLFGNVILFFIRN